MRIFVARLFHETNTFAPGVTPLENFYYRSGAGLLGCAGDGSILGTVVETAPEMGWEVVPSFDLSASPGPTVSDKVVSIVMDHIEADLPPAVDAGLDGIFLVLHGAMVSESEDDVEGLLLTRIRALVGDRNIPIAAVLDLHANVSPAMAENANMLVAYRCNPHTDAVETGLRTAALLTDAVRAGTSCSTHLVVPSILLPPTGTASAGEPMAGLLEIARRWEGGPICSVSICAGFALADTPYTGVTFQIVASQTAEAAHAVRSVSQELSEYVAVNASKGYPKEWELSDAVTDALQHGEFPALIVEPADNIGGGAPGDATWVLQEFLRKEVEGAGVILAAPEVVGALKTVEVGGTATIKVGGRYPDLCGPAITLPVTVLRHSNGVFDVEDPHSHIVSMRGTRIDMSKSVLVRSAGVTLLLTTRPTAPMDLGQWRCVGVDPASLRLIGVKAAVAHRQAYDPITRRSYTVSTPGPCTSDLRSLPFKKLRRPIHPLDPWCPTHAVKSQAGSVW